MVRDGSGTETVYSREEGQTDPGLSSKGTQNVHGLSVQTGSVTTGGSVVEYGRSLRTEVGTDTTG